MSDWKSYTRDWKTASLVAQQMASSRAGCWAGLATQGQNVYRDDMHARKPSTVIAKALESPLASRSAGERHAVLLDVFEHELAMKVTAEQVIDKFFLRLVIDARRLVLEN